MAGAPKLVVIGGPNGAGKTTFAREYLAHEAAAPRFLNTDEIARGLSPLDPSLSQTRAGRLIVEETRRLIAGRASFGLESTLSGRAQARWIEEAKAVGYHVEVLFLWLSTVEESVQRVRQRVAEGGHDVPFDDLRRRFPRCTVNFFDLYLPLADVWSLWDSSVVPPKCLGSSTANDVEVLRARFVPG
jgi:predicted ABC-type ATPase